MENEQFFFTRHSKKPKGEDLESSEFKGISEKGVELARERSKEMLDGLDKSEDGTVMLIGGASEVPRTKATAMVYGQEIKNIITEQKRDDVLVFLPEDLAGIDGFTNKINFLAQQVKANPDKKIVLDFPLFLKEFSLKDRWTEADGSLKSYTDELLKRNNYNEETAMRDWFENRGRIGDLVGPNPKEVAEEQMKGIARLREFAKKHFSDRPLIIGSVGHSWNLDALAVYLANDGEISKELFEKMNSTLIEDAGMIKIENKNGSQILKYGNIDIPLED